MPSTHIEAEIGEIAEVILLPGDPLRAQYIADTYLTRPKQFNRVRNMFGYTGTYHGKRVSVMGTGMGIPSMAIYAHELISHYGVRKLIRLGSAGSLQEQVHIRDIVIAQAASTDSNFGNQFDMLGELAAVPDPALTFQAVKNAGLQGLRFHVGHVFCTDFFYHADSENWKKWQKMHHVCVEMEAYALYLTANWLGASALTLLTISDSLVTREQLSQQDRQSSFDEMALLGLSLI